MPILYAADTGTYRLEEREMELSIIRVVSVILCSLYCVTVRQCYVAMPSGYKLVITRAVGMNGSYLCI